MTGSITSSPGPTQRHLTPGADLTVIPPCGWRGGAISVRALDLSPGLIGWDMLPVLNMTDRKLMAETWLAPARHATGAML